MHCSRLRNSGNKKAAMQMGGFLRAVRDGGLVVGGGDDLFQHAVNNRQLIRADAL